MSKTILIADDEPNIIKTMVQYFQQYQQNYNVYQAPHGKIALQIASEKEIDLIILDWDMPVMNGIETIKQLKNQEKTKAIPIIISTGTMIQDVHLSEALEKGAMDYVRKPMNPLELIARIRSAIRLSDSHQKIQEQKQEIIDHRNRELSSIAIQLANKNRLLLEIQKLLENKENSREQILKLIKNDIRLDKQWYNFKLHFEEVHPSFFLNLEKNYPSLSENELRICAYIKMRLENKEIMSLLNLAPKGLETARYRIKKQFKLSKKEDLNQFVRGF